MNKVPRAHTIAVRAYARPSQWKRPIGAGLRRSLEPSEWTLIFDTQTTMDAAQQLHFGSYHVRKAGVLQEVGLFYDPLTVTESECVLMHAYAQEHHLQVLTVEQFVEEVFFRYVSDLGALCVGFHLPFALSRLAIKHSSARGKTMRGGFSFQLSPNKRRPRLQIKHLHSRAALIRLTVPPRQQTPRSMRKRRQKVPNYRGSFVDVKTLASALLSGSWSLGTLAAHLQVGHRLPETEGQGTTLSGESLANVTQNVHVIWECFMQLQQRYRSYGLDRTPITRIYSEASIGKAYLRQMGIRPWQHAQPDFPPPLLGIIMSSLFGGRAEVHVRREVSRVLYCDCLSMYTTVCILLQLWAFVIAEHINWCEITSQVQAFLEQVRLEDLQQPKTWQQLTTWVQIESEDDLLPVRSTYDEQQYAIGLNYLTSQEPLWYTLADCIAAKLLSGRVPKVVQARHFSPSGMQGGLQPIAIAGNPAYWVDPTQQDFYRRLIELRQEVKAELKVCAPEERERLEAEQLALKITANASSYGISVELNVTQEDHLQEMTCYGHTGKPFKTWMNTIEEPGSYFHPLLATLITGAARLILAITQRLAEESGMSWAFCDTDSLAFVQPSNLRDADFLERVQRIQDWFEPLNPYRGKEPLLKIEAVNYRRDGERMEPLYALAISAKRYVLFNLDEQGKPIIRKASAHGLGHLLPPYDERQSPPSIAPPLVPLTEIGVERWQYDLWYRIVVAALGQYPAQVQLNDLPGFGKPAVSRYAATSPALLRWFKRYNRGKPYRDQVKPFNFLLAFQAGPRQLAALGGTATGVVVEEAEIRKTAQRRRKRSTTSRDELHPVAAYHPDPEQAIVHCFNRDDGKPIAREQLKTYREALRQYHLHPEAKFLHADYTDTGFTQRRHVQASCVEYIGKEANRWEEQYYLGQDPEAQIVYGTSPEELERLYHCVLKACQPFKTRELAQAARLSASEVSLLLRGKGKSTQATLEKLFRATQSLTVEHQEQVSHVQAVLAAVRQRCQQAGVRQFAEQVEIDAGNLGNVLAGRRKLSQAMLSKLKMALINQGSDVTLC